MEPNEKNEVTESEVTENVSEDYAVKKNRRSNIIALAVCVLIAFVLWLIIMNVDGNGNLPASAERQASQTSVLSGTI